MFKTVILIITLATALTSSAQALPDNTMNGIYDMKLDIGGTIFNDVMELKDLPSFLHKSPFTGSITVPGVFTAPIEEGFVTCHMWSDGCNMRFNILAKENGKEYRVYYQVYFNYANDTVLSGKASLENDVFLGSFTAVKRQ